MFLTREDYEKIERYLKQNAKKDSDFKLSDLRKNDCVVVNRDVGNNLRENFLIDLPKSLDGFLKSNITFENYSQWTDKDIGKLLVPANSIWEAINSNTTNIGINQLNSTLQNKLNNVVTDIKLNDGVFVLDTKSQIVQSIDTEGNKHLNLKLYYAGADFAGGPAKNSENADRVKHSLKIGNKIFNGSSSVTVTKEDLGVGAIFNYVGISTTYPITEGATVPNYNPDVWTKNSIVWYNDDNPTQEKDWSGLYLLTEDGNISSHWEKLNSGTAGFVSALEFYTFLNELYTRFGTPDSDNSIEHQISQINEVKYTKPEGGIPIGDLNTWLQENINVAVLAAYDYKGMVESGIELTSRKINEWSDFDIEDESLDTTIGEMMYPTAKLVKNTVYGIIGSLDNLANSVGDTDKLVRVDETGKVPTSVLPTGYDIAELLSKILKTTIALASNKVLAEIDGSSVNDVVKFQGKLIVETFGDFGVQLIDPRQFSYSKLAIDGQELISSIPEGENYIVATKQFIESSQDSHLVGDHTATLDITYNLKEYFTSCKISVNLRKFFFFGEFNNPDILSSNAFLATLSDGFTTNLCNLIFDDVEFNGISHFSANKNCTITIPAAVRPEGSNPERYIYFLIPTDMVGESLKVTQPDAFGASFDIVEGNNVTRKIVSSDPTIPETKLYHTYRVFRSVNPIDCTIAKKLTIS